MTTNDRPAIINDRYELSKRIGRGGMADVFLGRDRLLDRQVAIKVLFPEFAIDPNFVERFRREAQAAANLSHPNIVNVYDWGQPLRHLLHRHGVRRRPHAGRHPALERPRHRQAGGGDRQRGGRRARLRPRGRARAPRHQAGEHPDRLQRPGEGRRLRHRPGDERADRVEPHPGRRGDGHGDVLLARAGPGRPARPAQRPLLARHRDVRDGRRAAAVHRREPGRHRLQAGPRQPAAAEPDRRRRAPAVRGDRRQAAGQGPQGPLRDGRRAARRPAPVPQRRARCWPCAAADAARRRRGAGAGRRATVADRPGVPGEPRRRRRRPGASRRRAADRVVAGTPATTSRRRRGPGGTRSPPSSPSSPSASAACCCSTPCPATTRPGSNALKDYVGMPPRGRHRRPRRARPELPSRSPRRTRRSPRTSSTAPIRSPARSSSTAR